jgi:protein-tyrosine phosphatase
MDSMHYVTESLMVGNLEDAQNPPDVVSGLLYLAAEHQIKPPPGLLFEQIPLKEFGEADPLDVDKAIDWLERHESTHRVMVCCRAGMGRSVSVVIAHLCCVKEMSYADALSLLRARRPGTTPLPNLERTIEQVRHLRQARTSLGQAPPQFGEENQARGHDSH